MRSPWRESWRRRAAWLALILAVLVAHALLALRVLDSVIGWNTSPEPKRIEITFARQAVPTAPPAATRVAVPAVPAPAAPPPRVPRELHAPRASSAALPASAASEASTDDVPSASRAQLVARALALAEQQETAQRAQDAASAAEAAAAVAAAAPQVTALSETGVVAVSPAGSASAPAGATLPGPQRQSFAWPPSTRLTYTLSGLFRGGPIYGKATIEWRRTGAHYQVQFDIHVSPFFNQRMFSDGRITERGLSPQHYDETFDVPLMTPRVRKMEFTDDEVVLPNGNRVIKFPQTQDQASQFVQLVWTLATRPELLRAGSSIDMPLALTTGVHRWNYKVAGGETLWLPFGQIETVHLKPVSDGPRRPNEYPFEFWTAPSLQYLPVRVFVPIDDKNFADLSLDALPMQAAPGSDDAAASQPVP